MSCSVRRRLEAGRVAGHELAAQLVALDVASDVRAPGRMEEELDGLLGALSGSSAQRESSETTTSGSAPSSCRRQAAVALTAWSTTVASATSDGDLGVVPDPERPRNARDDRLLVPAAP